ncbi:MAG: hypothetical protein RBR63_07270, partial [Methanosarcina vacuolata]|nr:hypothetical protein [Methanosarcina vacuolata]
EFQLNLLHSIYYIYTKRINNLAKLGVLGKIRAVIRRYWGSGYVVRLTSNEIKNTVAPFNRDAYAGYAIAVTVPCKFNVISEGNAFSGNLKDVFGT